MFVVVVRGMYKDIVRLLRSDGLLEERQLRAKVSLKFSKLNAVSIYILVLKE